MPIRKNTVERSKGRKLFQAELIKANFMEEMTFELGLKRRKFPQTETKA